MRRREFIALAGAAAAFPRVAFAQQAAKVPHVVYLDTPRPQFQTDGLFQGLADRGYVDGKNVIVDWFTAPTNADLPVFAANAIASAPAVILAGNTPPALAAAQLTKTIPIVFRTNLDPVAQGLVSNLAHPGGNLTGAGSDGSIVAAKLFGFLKDIVPDLSRVAFFGRSVDGVVDAVQRADLLAAGAATGIEIVVIDIIDPGNFPPYFAQALAAGAQAVYAGTGYAYIPQPIPLDVLNALSVGQKLQPTYNAAYLTGNNNMITSAAIVGYLASLNALPTLSPATAAPGVANGILFGYGEPINEGFRRAAYFVNDIIRGAKPQDLPVDLPTKYDLQINLKTAQALGLVVPTDILLTATEVFE